MKITAVRAYRQAQPFRDGPYGTSGGVESGFDSLIVAIDTDAGITGWGEMAPLGAFYSPAFAAGARAGIPELAPLLVDATFTHPRRLMGLLDAHMQAQPYIKSAFDIALWDIAAQHAHEPLSNLTGGRSGESVELYRAIAARDMDECTRRATGYVAEGYRRLQIKVGGTPEEDATRVTAVRDVVGPHIVLYADANGGWTTAQARRFLRQTRDLDITIEQPCASLEECSGLRSACDHPMVLDESIQSLETLLRAHRHGIADGVTLKLSRLGGITPTLLLRDVACELGSSVTIEDTGGASIATAAILHLAHSTPERLRAHTLDFRSWVTTDNASGIPPPRDGRICAPCQPGLGLHVEIPALGEPLYATGMGA